MFRLRDNEKVLMTLHKHWWELGGAALAFLVFIALPPLILSFLPFLVGSLDTPELESIVNFVLALYLMVLFVFLFHFWMDYYLDMWIITTERLIDIEQRGLFSREVAEIPLHQIQDVTIEIHGIVETFLKFGTIKIQTAGEREFLIRNVPNLYEAKEVILKHANLKHKDTDSP